MTLKPPRLPAYSPLVIARWRPRSVRSAFASAILVLSFSGVGRASGSPGLEDGAADSAEDGHEAVDTRAVAAEAEATTPDESDVPGDETAGAGVVGEDGSTAADSAGSSPADLPPPPALRPPPPAPLPPGACTTPAAPALRAALARAEAGEPRADLDAAACYRAMGQGFPESAALARTLAADLDADEEALVRGRLEALGYLSDEEIARESAAAAAVVAAAPAAPAADPLWAYAAAGVSVAGLIAGTALGIVSLDRRAAAEADVTVEDDGTDLGIGALVCLGLGVGAGVAALLLWPDGEVAATSGPGDVGLGLEVRF
jgi:hypothetical protein